MKRLLAITAAALCVSAFAADLLLAPGQSATTNISVTATCIACPPPPPPIEVIKEVPVEVKVASPRPGNAHGAYHPDSVKKNGFENCQTCHSPTSTTPAKVGPAGNFICAQYEFCTSGLIAGKTDCKIGVMWNDLLTGDPVIDPITKDRIVSGGKVGGYATGSIPQCRDCHYPHATIKEPPKSAIHFGCLDCHVGIGNENLKAGIKK
jgi:hypothetical protein